MKKNNRWTIVYHYFNHAVAGPVVGIIALCIVGIMFTGCSPASVPSKPVLRVEQKPDATFCVMPFFKGRHPEQTDRSLLQTFTCPLKDLSVNTDSLAGEADLIIYQYVHQAMANRFGSRVAPMAATRSAYRESMNNCQGKTIQTMATEIGERLKTDYVVAGTVWRFREREGYAMSANAPASVGFSVFLLNTQEADIVWTGVFNHTQQPLSENLLNAVSFFKQGAKWLTASELAKAGVQAVFDKFPIRGDGERREMTN
ncbi:MAG: hypothetical protein SWH61_11870 [Thermodesulfobacteriota bacterium]|nr:hypothetical protein [Thermodesulfobacteriota bacterium]